MKLVFGDPESIALKEPVRPVRHRLRRHWDIQRDESGQLQSMHWRGDSCECGNPECQKYKKPRGVEALVEEDRGRS